MADVVDICNLALANLGEPADVTSVDPPEGSPHAERCARFYPLALNLLLESHEWRFATRQERLTVFAECDRENWSFRYAMPSECLRVIDVWFPGMQKYAPDEVKGFQDYEIALSSDGVMCLYTNIGDAVCRYVQRVDTRFFPASFVTALSWKLAAMLAGPMLRGSEGIKMVQSCEQMLMLSLEQAKALDAKQQRDYEESIPPWIRARDGMPLMRPWDRAADDSTETGD